MGRTFPLTPCPLPRLIGSRGIARASRAALVSACVVLAPPLLDGAEANPSGGQPNAPAGQPPAGQAATSQGSAVRAPTAHAAMEAAARRLVYPRWEPASGLAGEPFRSPSLGLQAPDMRLADFQVAAVPGQAGLRRFVAAALLEPQGFPAPYTLLEVAVLEQGDAGLRLLGNLKVRVDSGHGSGGLRMHLPPPEPPSGHALRFEVRVTDAADSLRHRFRQDRDGIALLESIIAR